MKHIYLSNPKIENDKYRIRLVRKKDLEQIFKLYSNLDNLKCVNKDDCNLDNFHYTTMEKVLEKYHFWRCAYKNKWFARFSIISKQENKLIGVLELMKRRSYDTFDNAIVLRLDLFKEYEKYQVISELLSFIYEKMLKKCSYSKIAVKATLEMEERVKALINNNFKLTNRILIGIEDNKSYKNYYVKK